MSEEKMLFGFGIDDISLFAETFDTVDELIGFAEKEYDEHNDEYFDEDQHCILVSYVKKVSASDFAPSLDDIADQMTDKFYSEHNINDNSVVTYYPKDEAEKEWKAFVEKYFDIPYTLIGYANVGWYDLNEHKWIKKDKGDSV